MIDQPYYVSGPNPKALHLPVFAYDRADGLDYPGTGRTRAVCGSEVGRGWNEGWRIRYLDDPKYTSLPLCSRCRRELDRFNAAAQRLTVSGSDR